MLKMLLSTAYLKLTACLMLAITLVPRSCEADDPAPMTTDEHEEDSDWLIQESGLSLRGPVGRARIWRTEDRLPGMIGDYFSGPANRLTGRFELDRLFVVADDLDSPAMLPSSGSLLTITEAGPVGVFSSSIGSIAEVQALLRSGASLPAASLAGQISDSATMTTVATVGEIQTLLASTTDAFDIVMLSSPPASYQTTVNTLFSGRNSVTGTTVFEQSDSGALLQAGVDTLTGGEDFDAFYFFSHGVNLGLPIPGVGSGVTGTEKLAQGSGALPRDRVFFNYGYFDDALLTAGGIGYNRFTPGIEKTVLDGRGSIELRLPFASSIDNPVIADGSSGTGDVRFGNLQIYLKSLIRSHDWLSVSGGLGISVPTERDLNVGLTDGTSLLRIENESVHLQPFIAAAFIPSERAFAQAILQLDFDTNGNSVALNSTGAGLTHSGTLQNAAMLYIDVSMGYWLVRDESPSGYWPSALAGILEVHHNQSLNDDDSVSGGSLTVGPLTGKIAATNIVVGTIAELTQNLNLSIGYVVPVSQDSENQFDGALRATVDWRLR